MSGGKKNRILLAVLAVLIVAAVAEYTLGGGWRTIKREYLRYKMGKLGAHQTAGTKRFFQLPEPSGPEDAAVKIVVFLNPFNPCHADFLMGWQKMVEPYADKVRLVFKDITSEEDRKLLAGYAVGCETIALINGLPQMRVPWLEEPVVFDGAIGPGGGPETVGRLIEWLQTEEGKRELKRQLAEFEKERQRRLEKERELAAEQQPPRARGVLAPPPRPPEARPSAHGRGEGAAQEGHEPAGAKR